ncbi:MAG: SseB family protein [Terriglobia bacterium]
MTLLAFVAETDIEHQILKAQDGELSGDALLRRMVDADLYIPSTGDVQADGSGFNPVLIDQDGSPFVVVFTALSRQPKDMAAYMMQMNGGQFFRRLPAGYGVMVNPGYDAQILVPPHGMAAFRQDLARPVAGTSDPR